MIKQKFTDLLPSSPEQRLTLALELIGVEDSDPQHERHNILSSISLYAASKGDNALEASCEELLKNIRLSKRI